MSAKQLAEQEIRTARRIAGKLNRVLQHEPMHTSYGALLAAAATCAKTLGLTRADTMRDLLRAWGPVPGAVPDPDQPQPTNQEGQP